MVCHVPPRVLAAGRHRNPLRATCRYFRVTRELPDWYRVAGGSAWSGYHPLSAGQPAIEGIQGTRKPAKSIQTGHFCPSSIGIIMSIRLMIMGLIASLLMVSNTFAGNVSEEAVEKSGMGFTHLQKTENPGSKSAGVRGVLLFEGLPIQQVSGGIRTPIGSFTFLESNLLFRPQGWFPVADIVVPSSPESVTSEMLQKGSYSGGLRIGTPAEWCYLVASNLWINPRLLVSSPPVHPLLKNRIEDRKPVTPQPSPAAASACQLKPERGPCKALMEVFYYDRDTRSCRAFFWGGCRGVAPFKSLNECKARCQSERE